MVARPLSVFFILLFTTAAGAQQGGSSMVGNARGTQARPGPANRPTAASQARAQGMARASGLLGKHVFDAQGNSVAQIRDIVIDSRGGLTAVIERSGSPGLTGIPLRRLQPQLMESPRSTPTAGPGASGLALPDRTASIDRFVFDGNLSQIQGAPVLKDMASVDDAWVAQTNSSFGVQSLPASASVGQQLRKPISFAELSRRHIATLKGDRLGDISDLAVDLKDGQAAFLVFGSANPQGNSLFHGVMLDSFRFDDPSNVLLDADPATLGRSPGLDLERLPAHPSFQVTNHATIRVPSGSTGPGPSGGTGKTSASDSNDGGSGGTGASGDPGSGGGGPKGARY